MWWIVPYCGVLWALVRASMVGDRTSEEDEGDKHGKRGGGGAQRANASQEAFIVASKDLRNPRPYGHAPDDDDDDDDDETVNLVQPAGLVALMRGACEDDEIMHPVTKPVTAACRPDAGVSTRPDLGGFLHRRNMEEMRIACARERS
jgi:hypothetical protein